MNTIHLTLLSIALCCSAFALPVVAEEVEQIDITNNRNVEPRVGVSYVIKGDQRIKPLDYSSNLYAGMLGGGSYEDIETTIQTAIAQNTLTSDGQPLLAAIFGGLSSCLSIGCGTAPHSTMFQFKKTKLDEWRRQHPNSVAAEVALAAWHVEYAWSINFMTPGRASGKEDWHTFEDALAAAEKVMNESSPDAQKNPAWQSSHLTLGLLQHWPQARFEAAYEQAVKNHPSYLPLHLIGAAYFSPRWYGSAESLNEFILKAAQSANKDGDALYARLYWAQQNRWMFVEGLVDWTRMKAGFESIQRQHSEKWIANHFARFACMAGDAEVVSAQAETIGDEPIVEVWDGNPQFFHGCSEWASKWLTATASRKEAT